RRIERCAETVEGVAAERREQQLERGAEAVERLVHRWVVDGRVVFGTDHEAGKLLGVLRVADRAVRSIRQLGDEIAVLVDRQVDAGAELRATGEQGLARSIRRLGEAP